MNIIQRCQAEVYKRDTYRYSGRGSSGFSMHYNIEQCSFKAIGEKEYRHGGVIKLCKRHLAMHERSRYVTRCNWDLPWEPRINETKS